MSTYKRGVVYSGSELNAMDLDELLKVTIRQAQKYNKQISRAIKAGKSKLLGFVGGKQTISIAALKKITDPKELAMRYQEAESRFKGGATLTNLKEMEKAFYADFANVVGASENSEMFQNLQKQFNRLGATSQQRLINKYNKVVAEGGKLRDAWYAALKAEVYTYKTISSFSPDDRYGTPYEYEGGGWKSLERMLDYVGNVLDEEKAEGYLQKRYGEYYGRAGEYNS